jgi:hypothetical protein
VPLLWKEIYRIQTQEESETENNESLPILRAPFIAKKAIKMNSGNSILSKATDVAILF